MGRRKYQLLLWFCLLIAACNNKPAKHDAVVVMPALPRDTTFNLEKLKMYFYRQNDLANIPFANDTFDAIKPLMRLDSFTVKVVYQDSIDHYFPDETGSGNEFYGYIDTFRNFNLVCMFTGEGDGGGLYELITFTKGGKRISRIEAAWLPGEENEWEYDETAQVAGYQIKVLSTTCHRVDSVGKIACDTLWQFYQFKSGGEMVLIKKDSVLNPVLDSIRKAIPYN